MTNDWVATYIDGTNLTEDGREGGAYKDIDRKNLATFKVGDFEIEVNPGERLMWRRRRSMNALTGEMGEDVAIVSLESANGVDVYVIRDKNQEPEHLSEWGEGPLRRPVPFDFEDTCRL